MGQHYRRLVRRRAPGGVRAVPGRRAAHDRPAGRHPLHRAGRASRCWDRCAPARSTPGSTSSCRLQPRRERVVIQELALEALRTVNHLSSLGGLLGSAFSFARISQWRREFRRGARTGRAERSRAFALLLPKASQLQPNIPIQRSISSHVPISTSPAVMVPDLLQPTPEMHSLCPAVVDDLYGVIPMPRAHGSSGMMPAPSGA
jgi:hypothetical protein